LVRRFVLAAAANDFVMLLGSRFERLCDGCRRERGATTLLNTAAVPSQLGEEGGYA
jgi:hypothetical protein